MFVNFLSIGAQKSYERSFKVSVINIWDS